MIWERFVASQMAAAIWTKRPSTSKRNGYGFRATGTSCDSPASPKSTKRARTKTRPKRPGRRTEVRPPKASPSRLPELHEKDPLDCSRSIPKQHFTEPPPRYTEASLVKALEENGIGRPSTYSTIVKRPSRGYVTQQERRFIPTEIGIAVNDLLVEHFPKRSSTCGSPPMEDDLDKVAEGTEDWVGLLRGFYGPFATELAEAETKLPKLELQGRTDR